MPGNLPLGLQYTHWDGTPGWNKILSGDKDMLSCTRMVAQAGWTHVPHIRTLLPFNNGGKIMVAAAVTGDPCHYQEQGSSGDVVIGENAGGGGKGKVVNRAAADHVILDGRSDA